MNTTPAHVPPAISIAPLNPSKMRRSPLAWLVVLVLAGLLGWYISANAGTWKDRFVPRKFRVVEPGQIYASGQIDRHLIRQVLRDHQIKEIICMLNDDASDPDVAEELKVSADLGIPRHNYPLSGDGTGDIHRYADAVTELVAAQKANLPTLIHCSSGAQRSNGATFYYRVFVQHHDADEAAAEMVRNGHRPHDNPMLIPYLNSHMAEMASLLQQRGVIDHIPAPLPRIQND
ncbi:MAG: hypothetical protein M3O30_01440 [Planctomycetota bacterium]|nr:hypothetical protein [Planctomycetota bacterium]